MAAAGNVEDLEVNGIDTELWRFLSATCLSSQEGCSDDFRESSFGFNHSPISFIEDIKGNMWVTTMQVENGQFWRPLTPIGIFPRSCFFPHPWSIIKNQSPISSSWWFQPIWKIWTSTLDHLPKDRDENNKSLKPPTSLSLNPILGSYGISL